MRTLRYASLRDTLQSARMSLPSMTSIIPHRIRRRFRSTRSKLRNRTAPSSSITTLQTSFSPQDTLHALRNHQWSFWDAQYLVLALFGIFALCLIQHPGPLFKTFVASLLLTSLTIPITRQFFLPLLPIICWLVFFYSAQFIAPEYRPPIWVRVLPALENIFYGANLSNILSAHKSTVLSVLAWLPYGITHFGAPFVVSIFLFIFGPPGTLPVFARTFGYMNLLGVITQLLLPCSPPWYENMYGLAPANYSIKGSPAGLAAIDELFGWNLYVPTFTASPLVFGAFPSLHAGSATVEALFMVHAFPRLMPLFVAYTLWLCWATMYLSHHYAVDLVGGSLLASTCFLFARSRFLPRMQPSKFLRWDYDYVETGEPDDSTSAYNYNNIPLNDTDDFDPFGVPSAGGKLGAGGSGNGKGGMGGGDGLWDLGSSSSYSGAGSSLGERSPVDAMGDKEGDWEGETLASGSDVEKR